eukprot:Phypoly_transcript_10026.p1 GENE.Phypoly_transcript_10026~~Phypoly_transcript_10026.p1  ORF type:complete len:290 (+),score=14.91 Phypoly_transcript_10026:40-870(+)
MDILLGSEYLCSLILSYNNPHTLFCVCPLVCKSWRRLLSSHSSDCCIWKGVYKAQYTSPQSHEETEGQWVALNKSIYKSNIATYENFDDNCKVNCLSPIIDHSSSPTFSCKTDNQGVFRIRSYEKKRVKKSPGQSWRTMVQLNCVPTPRNLHFLYLKGKATEIHSGLEFHGSFDILMLGFSHYFIRIQEKTHWRIAEEGDKIDCRGETSFGRRPLRTRTRRLCFEEREDKEYPKLEFFAGERGIQIPDLKIFKERVLACIIAGQFLTYFQFFFPFQ